VELAHDTRDADRVRSVLGPHERGAQHDRNAEDGAAKRHPRLLLLGVHDASRLYRMLMIRSSDSGETSSAWPQAGHFDCTLLARMRSVARTVSTTTVRMRCVPHFAQVQPDDRARAIGGEWYGMERGQSTPAISLTRDDQNADRTG
jgi:hypothetical protein